MFAFLDLDSDLHVVVRPRTLVVTGKHDEHQEERRQKLDCECLALGHVTSWDSTSGRCPCDDVICGNLVLCWWRHRDIPEHEGDGGSKDCPGELGGEIENPTSETDTSCCQHGESNSWVDVGVTDGACAIDSRSVRQTERQRDLQQPPNNKPNKQFFKIIWSCKIRSLDNYIISLIYLVQYSANVLVNSKVMFLPVDLSYV